MPDSGLSSSLLASPNYAVRRQDNAQNLILAKQMRDDAIAQTQERMKSMGAISEYLNKSKELENQLLPNDAERFRAAEDKIRKTHILESLQQNHNDPTMFMMTGGGAALDSYARDLSGSEELRTGIENKKNFQLGTDATMKKEVITPVQVEFDGGTKETVDWHDALDLYNKKIIKKLPFDSAVPLVAFDPLEFAKIEAPDSEKKYNGFVSAGALQSKIQAENPTLTDQQAKAQAEVYRNKSVPGATILSWGRRLPHTSGGFNTFRAKQALEDQSVLERYQWLKQGLTNPQLIEQTILNLPYQGGYITGYRVIPAGTKVKVSGTNKVHTYTEPIGVINYQTKTGYKGALEDKQEEVPLNKKNGFGINLFNRLANTNREGTAGFVNQEKINLLYQNDPDFFPGAGSTQSGGGGTQHFDIGGQGYDIPLDQVDEFKKDMGIK